MEQIREQRRYQPIESRNQTSNITKKGHAYGPGDGTGNDGIGPRDGTGYGAPIQR
jgi:hypothetical protein